MTLCSGARQNERPLLAVGSHFQHSSANGSIPACDCGHVAGGVPMTVIRKNVYELGGNWAEPILWYARGVKAMKARALNDKTSWRFYGAMHGIDRDLWQQYDYLSRSDTFPAKSDIDKYWDQCQHGSWYFLPW